MVWRNSSRNSSRSTMNRSRRGLFSAAARSTLGNPLASSHSRRDCYSSQSQKSYSSQSQKRIDSTRGQVYTKTGAPKPQQKQQHQPRGRIGNSVANLLNDSIDDDLYMSMRSGREQSARAVSKTALDRNHYSLPPRSSSQSMTASQLCASSRAPTNPGLYVVVDDDDSMFMSGNFSDMDLSDSTVEMPVIKDFDDSIVANLVRQFVSAGDENAPQALRIARKIRDLSDYALFSDKILNGSVRSSSVLPDRQPKSNASILSTRPW